MLSLAEAGLLTGHAAGGACPFGLHGGIPVCLDSPPKRSDTVFPACGSRNGAIEPGIDEPEKYSRCPEWGDVCNKTEA